MVVDQCYIDPEEVESQKDDAWQKIKSFRDLIYYQNMQNMVEENKLIQQENVAEQQLHEQLDSKSTDIFEDQQLLNDDNFNPFLLQSSSSSFNQFEFQNKQQFESQQQQKQQQQCVSCPNCQYKFQPIQINYYFKNKEDAIQLFQSNHKQNLINQNVYYMNNNQDSNEFQQWSENQNSSYNQQQSSTLNETQILMQQKEQINTSHVTIGFMSLFLKHVINIYKYKYLCRINPQLPKRKEKKKEIGSCPCHRCKEYDILLEHRSNKIKNINTFKQLMQSNKKFMIFCEDYLLNFASMNILSKNYKSKNSKQAMYQTLNAFLKGGRDINSFYKLM